MFSTKNILLFVLGVLTIIGGYICLGAGTTFGVLSMTVAPFLLVAAYCIIIPVAIFSGGKNEEEK